MASTPGEPDDGRRPAATFDVRRHSGFDPTESVGAAKIAAAMAAATTVAEFTAFYRESMPRLVTFLRWQGAQLPDAADCAQDALAQAFQQWTTLRNPRAWCRLVASRLYARQVATIREQPVDDLDRAPGAPLLATAAELEEIEHRHDVLALLDHLPSRQRQVLAWTYDGATPTEIAEALQITPETVRSNLYKARRTLRTVSGEER